MSNENPPHTWKEIKKRFPALAEAEDRIKTDEIKIHATSRWYCANERWVKYYKRIVIACVGWNAEDSDFSSHLDYDTAYQSLYQQMPNCRECGCL